MRALRLGMGPLSLADPVSGRPDRDAGDSTRVTDARPAGPRCARPPHLLRVPRGGAPRRQPMSAGHPDPPPEVLAGGGAGGRTSWGAQWQRAS
jgi:hypothetical protein